MADPEEPKSSVLVGYKVIDQPYSPSDPAVTEAMLDNMGLGGNKLSIVYPDPQRGKTRWVFVTGATNPVPYKVVDQPWSPSDPTIIETMLNQIGQAGWQLLISYPDSRRERTRWIFNQGSQATIPVGGTNGQVQYNAAGTLAGAANFTISNGNPNVIVPNAYQYDGKNIFRGTDTTYYLSEAGHDYPGTTSYAIGYGAIPSNTGEGNVAIGVKALQSNTVGTYNVAIGWYSLNVDLTGNNNVAIGQNALSACTSSGNIGVGAHAGAQIVSGDSNTVIGGWGGFAAMKGYAVLAAGGEPALWVDTFTSYSLAIGWKAGNLAGISSSSGTGNTSLGAAAGYSLTTGGGNTFIGSNAGQNVDAGNSNIFIGYHAGQNITSGTGNIIIGAYNGTAAMSNQVVLADGSGDLAVQYDGPSKTWQTPTTTVATLPAAGTPGRRAFVTDANAATFNTVLAGGGTNKLPVFDDGTSWRIG